MDIIKAIQQLADKGEQVYCELGIIKKIDTNTRTATVYVERYEREFYGVAFFNNAETMNGLVIYPKLDSLVTLGFYAQNVAFIIAFSEVEKVEISFDAQKLTYDGKLSIENSQSNLKSELNNLCDLVIDLIGTLQAFKLLVPIPVGGFTLSVEPTILLDLAKYGLKVTTIKNNLNTLLK